MLLSFLTERCHRRIVERFAEVVCPPEVRATHRATDVVVEVNRYLAAFPPHLGLGLRAAFWAFDSGARIYPPATGRRFVDLDDIVAARYLSTVADCPAPGLHSVVKLMRDLVAMSYYGLPAVKEELGYRPDPWIAEVSTRRLATYGEAIHLGEEAVFAGGGPRAPERPHPGQRRQRGRAHLR